MLKRLNRIKSKISVNRYLFYLLSVLPILLFFWQYLGSGTSIFVGDFDYYAQMYEAFRITVLEYGQFPSWNPWMSGGIALYANPQFGLISLQSILVLVFGGIYGLKLAYVIYAIAGFWGMYVLSRNVANAPVLRSLLVSYLWIFSGFFAGHNINHFTFSLFFLFPWMLFLLFRWKERLSWLYLGLLTSLIALSAMHYALLMSGLGLVIFVIFLSVSKLSVRKLGKDTIVSFIVFTVKTSAIILLLCAHRVITAYSFLMDNPRPEEVLNERSADFFTILQALFLPVETVLPVPHKLQWGWGEYSAYLGFGTTLAFIIVLFGILIARSQLSGVQKHKLIIFGSVAILGILLALGNFGALSPYALIHSIPGFAEFRVSSRWLFLSMLSILVIIAITQYRTKLVNFLLVLGILELFFVHGYFAVIQNSRPAALPQNIQFSQTFSQYDNEFNHINFDDNINYSQVYKTLQNQGQIYGDDSIVNTLNRVIGTKRCGYNIDPQCDLVLSNNASIVYWSPNKIHLKRTAPGPISLNMNPNKYWVLNEKTYPFSTMTRIDPNMEFVFTTEDQDIRLEYAPRFSPAWFRLRS